MIQPIFKALALTIITLTFSSQALAFEQNFYSFSQGTAANDLLTNAEPVFVGIQDRLTFVEIVRHPLYMLIQHLDFLYWLEKIL